MNLEVTHIPKVVLPTRTTNRLSPSEMKPALNWAPADAVASFFTLFFEFYF